MLDDDETLVVPFQTQQNDIASSDDGGFGGGCISIGRQFDHHYEGELSRPLETADLLSDDDTVQ